MLVYTLMIYIFIKTFSLVVLTY